MQSKDLKREEVFMEKVLGIKTILKKQHQNKHAAHHDKRQLEHLLQNLKVVP